jgi:hypothetical protein
MPPNSYLEREQLISTTLNSIKSEEHGERIPDEQTDSGEERQGVLGVVGEDGTSGRKLARMENRKPVDRAQGQP